MLNGAYKRRLTRRFCSRAAAGITTNIVYIGGSITAGSVAPYSNTWPGLTASWLDQQYPDSTFTHYNKGISGSLSWYMLVRLQTDVLDLAPDLVIMDWVANDSHTDPWGQPSAEANIRRIRTALPNTTIAFIAFPAWVDPNTSTPVDLKVVEHASWKRLCNHYGIAFVDYRKEILRLCAATGDPAIDWGNDYIHPNTAGNRVAHELMRSVLAPRVESDTTAPWKALSAYPRINAATADYENTPIIQNGTAGTTSGTWSTVATTAKQSSEVNATIAFTGTFQSWGLDTNIQAGAGTLAWKVDGGAETTFNLSAEQVTNRIVPWAGTRGSHTVTLRVVSGTVRIDRFLAV